MQEKNKRDLDEIMREYQSDLKSVLVKKAEEENARKNFKQEFERLKHEIIWPTIIDIGNELTQYGHDFHVSEEEEYTDAIAHFHPASITFNIYPASLDPALRKKESAPYISFVANSYAKRIGIMVSTMMPNRGGMVGEHGSYEISKITPRFVEKEIVDVLKNTSIFHEA